MNINVNIKVNTLGKVFSLTLLSTALLGISVLSSPVYGASPVAPSSSLLAQAPLSAQASAQAQIQVQAQPLSPSIAESFIQSTDSASIYTLHINQERISAEVVATDESRALGLMNRFDLPENYGMLFVFPDSQKRCFWMKNTYIPLSIAYIDEQGKIGSQHDMQPHDVSSVCSLKPAMFALEVKQGWFAEKNIKVGDTIRLEEHLKP